MNQNNFRFVPVIIEWKASTILDLVEQMSNVYATACQKLWLITITKNKETSVTKHKHAGSTLLFSLSIFPVLLMTRFERNRVCAEADQNVARQKQNFRGIPFASKKFKIDTTVYKSKEKSVFRLLIPATFKSVHCS